MAGRPGKASFARQAIKYGPVVYALAQRYGPAVMEQILRNREPAQKFVQERAAKARTNPRKLALAHADSVVEGSLQQVFHEGRPYWVVYSRGEAVGVHPHVRIPFETLLLNVDTSKRRTPDELRRTVTVPRRPKRGRG